MKLIYLGSKKTEKIDELYNKAQTLQTKGGNEK